MIKNIRKYNKVWDKIKKLFRKEFNGEPVYNDKYIKIKINLYDTKFYGNKTPVNAFL